LRRAVGVYENFTWKNDPIILDVAQLADTETTFPMALPKVQTDGCEAAQQTVPLVLRPGYTREDTIGNYMIEYNLRISLTNSAKKRSDRWNIVFGKADADVGLAYQATIADPENEDPLSGSTVEWRWAGPKQKLRERAFLDESFRLDPGETRDAVLKFRICGNSSLPFYIGVKKAD
jgi:hypothetical protein